MPQYRHTGNAEDIIIVRLWVCGIGEVEITGEATHACRCLVVTGIPHEGSTLYLTMLEHKAGVHSDHDWNRSVRMFLIPKPLDIYTKTAKG